MIKYFSMDLGFVVNFSCNLDLLQSCVHFLLEVITILNDARLSLYDVNVGEVSRSVILSYLIIFKDVFFFVFFLWPQGTSTGQKLQDKNDDNQYPVLHFYCAYCFLDNNANFSAVVPNNDLNIIVESFFYNSLPKFLPSMNFRSLYSHFIYLKI